MSREQKLALISNVIQKKNGSVCEFCESNIQNEVKAF